MSVDLGVTNKFSWTGEFSNIESMHNKDQLYLGMELLDALVILHEAFWRNAKLLSKAAPFFNLTGK